MQMKIKQQLGGIVLFAIIGTIWYFYPVILFKVTEWQRLFNSELSSSLKSLQANSTQAGFSLIVVSFLYGVFHAVGPGHGKFILTGYLSFEQTKLPQAIKITLLSALAQGIVAISVVTVVVVLFTLSRQYFNLTLKWIERGSFLLMIAFGGYWLYQVGRKLLKDKRNKRLKITKILQISGQNRPLATQVSGCRHQDAAHCSCGHRHLPSHTEIEQARDWKSLFMLILSIGLRPCSGAILVLFLAYTLDLYAWGVLSALAMALGTGLTLSLFACLVLFARNRAIQAGKWYLSFAESEYLALGLKLLAALILILLGVVLFHSSLLDSSGSILFKR